MTAAVWPPLPPEQLLRKEEESLVMTDRLTSDSFTFTDPSLLHRPRSSNGSSRLYKIHYSRSKPDSTNVPLCLHPAATMAKLPAPITVPTEAWAQAAVARSSSHHSVPKQ